MDKSYGDLARKFQGSNGPKVSAPILGMDQAQFTKLFREILRALYGRERYAVQTIADHAGVNERTAKNWWEGRCLPGAFHLERLKARDPRIDAELRRLRAMERNLHPDFQQSLVRIRQELSAILDEET